MFGCVDCSTMTMTTRLIHTRGSMGLVYLPTSMVGVYGINVGKYTMHLDVFLGGGDFLWIGIPWDLSPFFC